MAIEAINGSIIGLLGAIPVFAYVRNFILIGADPNVPGEKDAMRESLKRLNIPTTDAGYWDDKDNWVDMWGSGGFEGDGSVQCGRDDYVLPNGMTSGELKDAVEADLKSKGFQKTCC